MISVLVAFIILLIGIAGFGRAITAANNLVRRAEKLNAATGAMLERNFYPDYAEQTPGSNYVLEVHPATKDASGKVTVGSDVAFNLHGRLRTREYNVTITQDGEAEPETEKLTYQMYYYK